MYGDDCSGWTDAGRTRTDWDGSKGLDGEAGSKGGGIEWCRLEGRQEGLMLRQEGLLLGWRAGRRGCC